MQACLTSLQLKAVEDSKEQTITLEISKGTISEAFSAIEKQSNFKFFYNSDQVDLNKTIDIKTKASSIESVLNKVFKDTNIAELLHEPGPMPLVDQMKIVDIELPPKPSKPL